jgi:AraC family transcriptional regulator
VVEETDKWIYQSDGYDTLRNQENPMSKRPLTIADPGHFEFYCHSSPATVYPEEAHETVQICIPLENALYSVTRQSETGRKIVHHLGSRDVLVVPIGQPHSVTWRRQADIVSLQVSEAFIASALDVSRLRVPEAFTVRDPFISAAAAELRASLCAEGRPNLIFAEAIATTIAYRIGTGAKANGGIRAKDSAPAFSGRDLARIERFIEEGLDQPITVSMLAKLSGLSMWHFMRRFNASHGMSPHSFVTRRRLLRAGTLLSSTKLSIAEIALEIGMTHSHLSRTFLKQFGVSPREFRRLRQE